MANVPLQTAASFAPNELGLYDLSDNVAEWVLDRYQSSYQGLGSDNPVVTEGHRFVVRGGGIVRQLPGAAPLHVRCSARAEVRSARERFGIRLVRDSP